MSLYTRTGDAGSTGLTGGTRVSKSHPRIEASGCLDEVNVCLGLVIQGAPFVDLRERLRIIQHQLFTLGGLISAPPETPPKQLQHLSLDDKLVGTLEEWIDQAEAETPPLRNFILPGGTETACRLHQARAVCRRAERAVVRLAEQEPISEAAVPVLNRLSDLLYAWARCANHRDGVEDVPWQKEV